MTNIVAWIPSMIMVWDTSKRPQIDIRHYLGPYIKGIRLQWFGVASVKSRVP